MSYVRKQKNEINYPAIRSETKIHVTQYKIQLTT